MSDRDEQDWARSVLADNYTEEGCRTWWRSFNRNTGGIPAEQWGGTGHEAVVRELNRLDGGGGW
jgi:hypothetical protein